MKKIFRNGLKWLLVILYPFVVVALVIFGVLYLTKNGEIVEAQNEYKKVQRTYNIEASADQPIAKLIRVVATEIDSKDQALSDAEKEIEDLKSKIENGEKTGLGLIQGAILPFVTNQNGLRQYQMVCAELVDNTNRQYCITVSAIQKKYSLNLPEGEYNVFATVLNSQEYSDKAYYTEFVVCSTSEKNTSCAEALREKKISVKVGADKTVENVDPVDWKFEAAEEKI
jgi:hypothetical protein